MKQAKQLPITKKQMINLRFILWVLGISVILAFAGTVLTIVRSVGHVVYPAWLQIAWDTVNVLLLAVVTVGVYIRSISKYFANSSWKGWLEYLVDLIILAAAIYGGQQTQSLSIVAFIFLAMLFLPVWRAVPDEMYTK